MGEEDPSGGGLGRSFNTARTDHGLGLGRRDVWVLRGVDNSSGDISMGRTRPGESSTLGSIGSHGDADD